MASSLLCLNVKGDGFPSGRPLVALGCESCESPGQMLYKTPNLALVFNVCFVLKYCLIYWNMSDFVM